MELGRDEREWMESLARAAGFDAAGVAAVPVDGEGDRRFSEWVAAGRAGEMEYLKREGEDGELVRGDVRRSMPWARSVLVCAVNYGMSEQGGGVRSIDEADAGAGWIARYAWSGRGGKGSDYHDVLLERLRVVEAEIRERFAGVEMRCYVDTGPVVEREYAARAGVGWIGRNTCVISQEQGSWLLLGVIVMSAGVAAEAMVVAAADRCGRCMRCVEACPTEALLGDRTMDASRCIAYLTIEKKGAIEEELRPLMGRQVFGCDICQEVCPWNSRGSRKTAVGGGMLEARRELVNPALEWLAGMDGREFNRWFRGSPLERTRRKRVLRNVAIAMGNSGEERFRAQLEEWSGGEDEVLAESARWALKKVGSG